MSSNSPLRPSVDHASGWWKTAQWHTMLLSRLILFAFEGGFHKLTVFLSEAILVSCSKLQMRILDLKKRKCGTTYYFTATPSTLPGSCLLHSKHISSCCLLFFILLNSSNPWLITGLPIFFYFWLSWILERPPLFLRRARNCLAKQRKDSSIAILQVVPPSSQPHVSWDFYPRPLLSPNKHFLMMISNSHIPVGRAHFSGE